MAVQPPSPVPRDSDQPAIPTPSVAPPAPGLRARLNAAPDGQRVALLHEVVRGLVADILRLEPTETLDPARPLRDLGLDSLRAVELRNALTSALEVPLPATLLFTYPTVECLVEHLSGETVVLEAHRVASGEPPDSRTAAFDHLSEDDLAALLANRLDAIDKSKGGPL